MQARRIGRATKQALGPIRVSTGTSENASEGVQIALDLDDARELRRSDGPAIAQAERCPAARSPQR
jgi:hypothetical protein